MRSVLLLVFGLSLLGVSTQDGARAQASAPPPLISGLAPTPNPAADYDGFSAGIGEEEEARSQAVPPARSRGTKGFKPGPSGIARQQLDDQDDDALNRKLTICKSCK